MPHKNPKSTYHPVNDWQGFTLDSVCWGYRSLFNDVIEDLYQQGLLGAERQETTMQFFRFLKKAEKPFYDQVLKEFLAALNPEMSWIMSLPGIFTDLINMGGDLASKRLHLGSGFFKLLGEGALGTTPEKVRYAITICRGLSAVDADLAYAFLIGYKKLSQRLNPSQIDQYIDQARSLHHEGHPDAAKVFLEGLSRQSEETIRSLTQECSLKDIEASLGGLILATSNHDSTILSIHQLSLDDIVERGTRTLSLAGTLYLPSKILYFPDAALNRDWYRLAALMHSAALNWNSFQILHGCRHYRDCSALVDHNITRQNLFIILEYSRIIHHAALHWPGIRSLLAFGFSMEYRIEPAETPVDALFEKLVGKILNVTSAKKYKGSPDSNIDPILEIIPILENVFSTVRMIRDNPDWIKKLVTDLPELANTPIRIFSFISDFRFPVNISNTPLDTRILQMRNKAGLGRSPETLDVAVEESAYKDPHGEHKDEEDIESETELVAPAGAFIYDEWSQPLNDYFEDYCQLFEIIPKSKDTPPQLTDEALEAGQNVRKIFENLKPALMNREKYLETGDTINSNQLVEYLTLRKREPSPKINFYEKPHFKKRDLAVIILLDLSGSTSKKLESRSIITIERDAAFILAEGLEALGDRFEIAGFNSKGREQNHYSIVKAFTEEWNDRSLIRLHSVFPTNSTRMGTALRHASKRIGDIEAKTRLILMITDGRPMDADYDPNTRYAHFDVRRACEENLRKNIHTFALSTDENTFADMEIMFPQRRFAILDDMRDLPKVLPQLYTKLTI